MISLDTEINFNTFFLKSIILNTDGYKPSHWLQYPPGTQYVEAYIESRGGRFGYTEFYGLQMFQQEYLTTPITQEEIDIAEAICHVYGAPFNKAGWQYILDKHGGYLPIEISAVKEGSIIPTGNLLVKIINTDPECYWLPSYVETALLRGVWEPTSVATLSRAIKELCRKYLRETADDESGLEFMLNDFGARGTSSFESAGIGGSGHDVNFKGSDTITGALFAMKYYGLRKIRDFPIRTAPAAEHSSITSWMREGELLAYRNMLNQFGGKYPVIAVVSDSYNVYEAASEHWGTTLKEEVIKCGSMLVIRPDSGRPVEVICKLIQILADKFGFTVNKKGYKVLKHVRLLQGDGVDYLPIQEILEALKRLGFSACNIVFGMGGKLLQGPDRDMLKWAQKTCAICINGVWYDVFKDPITDSGKRSKKGRLMTYRNIVTGVYFTMAEADMHVPQRSEPVVFPTYRNGKVLTNYVFTDIQATAEEEALKYKLAEVA